MNELTGRCTSDEVYPDEKDFYVYTPEVDFYDWDIDFNQNRIELTYTSIEANDPYYEYRHYTPKGFHFHDAGSRYFCESLFWASQPKQSAKT